MIKLLLFCFFFLVTGVSHASSSQVDYEKRYYEFVRQIQQNGKLSGILDRNMDELKRNHNPSLAALWDLLKDNNDPQIQLQAINALKEINKKDYSLTDQIYIYLLEKEFLDINDKNFLEDLNNRLVKNQLSREVIFTLLSYQDEVDNELINYKMLSDIYKNDFDIYESATSGFRSKTKLELKDLFLNHPGFGDYRNGQYANGIKLFMFCRKNREQTCMFLMKDKYSNIVRNADGSIWSQPALGLSRKRLPYNKKNGYTPSGVFQMDGVMPEADRKIVYGKNRRIILDFPKKSPDETELKKLLPTSAHDKDWWKQGVVARDIGRGALRIHGTGMRNGDSESSYYPFVPTSGCIAQREKKYNGVNYQDQRLLLDKMMQSLELPAQFGNETKIRGLLFVIEIDDKEEAVTTSELIELLDLSAFQS